MLAVIYGLLCLQACSTYSQTISRRAVTTTASRRRRRQRYYRLLWKLGKALFRASRVCFSYYMQFVYLGASFPRGCVGCSATTVVAVHFEGKLSNHHQGVAPTFCSSAQGLEGSQHGCHTYTHTIHWQYRTNRSKNKILYCCIQISIHISEHHCNCSNSSRQKALLHKDWNRAA